MSPTSRRDAKDLAILVVPAVAFGAVAVLAPWPVTAVVAAAAVGAGFWWLRGLRIGPP